MGIGAGAGMAIAAGVSAAGGLASSAIGSSASSSAASTQSAAANQASAQQLAMFNKEQANLSPYVAAGNGQINNLTSLTNSTNTVPTANQQAYGLSSASGTYNSAGSNYADADQEVQSGLNNFGTAQGYYGQQAGQISNATGAIGQQGTATSAASADLASARTNAATAQSGTNELVNGISQSTLDNTPGYQFTLQQGLESTQNSAAARGLGSSGAAEKAAAAYATGLANSTYASQAGIINEGVQDANTTAATNLSTASGQLNQASAYGSTGENYLSAANQYGSTGNNELAAGDAYLSGASSLSNIGSGETNLGTSQLGYNSAAQGNITNDYNRLTGQVTTGENAAATTGSQGLEAANASGNYLTSGAASSAAGTIGSANALAGGIGSLGTAANSYAQYQQYNQLLNGGSTVGSTDQAALARSGDDILVNG